MTQYEKEIRADERAKIRKEIETLRIKHKGEYYGDFHALEEFMRGQTKASPQYGTDATERCGTPPCASDTLKISY